MSISSINTLILGSGGREHALYWAIKQSKQSGKLYSLPNLDNIDTNLYDNKKVDISNFENIYNFCKTEDINLIIIGSEALLSQGITDYLKAKLPQINVLGPNKNAAQLESSKEFAHLFAERNNIKMPRFKAFQEKDLDQLKDFLTNEIKFPCIFKADGLAGGKGVIQCDSLEEGITLAEQYFQGMFGEAGSKIIIEEFITGEEFSSFALFNSTGFQFLCSAQDYKKIYEGETGDNTGGMGSTITEWKNQIDKKAIEEIFIPTFDAIKKESIDFIGVLFAGLMLTPEGELYLLEFNTRFGDPETQSIVRHFKPEALFNSIYLCASNQKFPTKSLQEIANNHVVNIVIANKGYPKEYIKGDIIPGLLELEKTLDSSDSSSKVFHAGTKKTQNNYIANQGRVLSVSVAGDNFNEIHKKAYQLTEEIKWTNSHYRKDIGENLLKK